MKREDVKLAITRDDINKYLRLNSDHKVIRNWGNIIMYKVKHQTLSNYRPELIMWMTGVADGWIKYSV